MLILCKRIEPGSIPGWASKTVKGLIINIFKYRPSLELEWDYSSNTLQPEEVSHGSEKKIHWTCPLDHKYVTSAYSRCSLGSGCPFCSGNKVLKGFNDLQFKYPKVALEWDYTKNSITPDSTLSRSGAKAWWVCIEYGHSWYATIDSRAAGNSNCPVCSNKKVLQGFNDVATTHPEVAKYIHGPEKYLLTSGSKKFAKFTCDLGHNWFPSIVNAVRQGPNCAICANKEVLIGFNDLDSTHPEIGVELFCREDAFSYTYGSNTIVDWLCPQGHQYSSSIDRRTLGGLGCSTCVPHKRSTPERLLKDLLSGWASCDPTKNLILQIPWRRMSSMQVDILLVDYKTIVEYDGEYWHTNMENRDIAKTKSMLEAGYKVIRVRESVHGTLSPLEIHSEDYHEIVYARNTAYSNIDSVSAMIKNKIQEWREKNEPSLRAKQ